MKKLEYIDLFRGIAISIIVAGHSLVVADEGVLQKITSYLFDGGTYLFVFIGGFLFYYLKDKFKYFNYLKNKFLYVICPSIIILLPGFISFLMSGGGYHALENSSIKYKVAFAITWPFIINPPIWYIGMIVVIFLLSPVLLALIKRIDLFIFVLLLTYFLGILYYRGWPVIDYGKTSKINILLIHFLFNFRMALHFISFYLLGMAVCKFWQIEEQVFFVKIDWVKISFFCWVLLGIAGIFIKSPFCPWNIYLFLSKTCLVFWLFGFLKNNCDRINIRVKKILKFLSEYSFSIFFLHFIIRNLILKKCLFNGIVPDSYILFKNPHSSLELLINGLILFFLMLAGSIIIAWSLKNLFKLLGIKKTRIFIGV